MRCLLTSGRVVLWLPLTLVVGGCLPFLDPCGNRIIRQAPAPGGQLKAVIFERNCGATTGLSTQVSLLGAQEALPNDGGNIFVTDNDPNITVAWLSSSQLKIVYNGSVETFNKQAKSHGVSIVYQTR